MLLVGWSVDRHVDRLTAAQPIRFRIQHRVQRFLDRSADHLPKMILDPSLSDPDHLAHRGVLLVVYPSLLKEPSILKVRKILCDIVL